MDSIWAEAAKKKWHYIHHRFRTPLFVSLLWEGASKRYDPDFHFPYETDWFMHLQGEIAIAEDVWQAMHDKIAKELLQNPKFLLKAIERAYSIDQRVETVVNEIANRHFDNSEQLLAAWQQYVDISYKFGSTILLPLFVEEDMEQQLKQKVHQHLAHSEQNMVYQTLTTPAKVGTAARQHEMLLVLAVKEQQHKLTDKDIEQYLAQFSWTKNNAFDGQFLSKKEVLAQIKELQKTDVKNQLNQYQLESAKHHHQLTTITQQLKGDSYALTLIETIQESIYFRSWRSERYYYYAYQLQKFYEQVAKAIGVAVNDLFYLAPHEITKLLKNHQMAKSEIIAERKTGFGIVVTQHQAVIISGSELAKVQSTIQLIETHQATVIHGKTAYPGKVQGVARLVLSKAAIRRVKAGEILITPSTTVDYVPILRQVKGIVTDEGGVLSHASVISRELHIPCVIGTKNATKVLKDGDMVEVDANNGMVKVLKLAQAKHPRGMGS